MTYNPNTGISSNKAPALLGIPIDHRTWKQTGPDDNENNIYRPFNSENEVLAYFDTYDKREGGFEIDVLTNGKISKYQFVNGELKPMVGGDYIETNIDEINNKVTQNTTSISQNAHEIALKANQTDVNTLSGRVTQHDASFVITAKEIASKVSQKDFNLLGQAVYNAETSIAQTAQQIQLKASKQSVDELTGRVVVAESSITQTAESIALKADKSVVDSLTGTVNDNTAELLILSDEIATKVSSTVTDALGTRLSTAESNITQQSDLIESKVSNTQFNELGGRVTSTESKITQLEGDITSVVTQSEFDTLDNRVGLAESSISQQAGQISSKVEQSTFNALGTRVTNAESAITQNATNINLKVSQTDFTGSNLVSQINLAPDNIKIQSKNINIDGILTVTSADAQARIDNLQIGGRNLYSKSGTTLYAWDGTVLNEQTSNGFTITGISANTASLRIGNIIKSNGWYVLSFDARVQYAGVTMTIDFSDQNTKSISLTTTASHYEFIVEITNWTSDTYNFIDFAGLSGQAYYFTNFKFEKGNKATDWTPAPEDVEAAIDAAKTYADTKVAQTDVLTRAYADGIVTDAEALAIAEAAEALRLAKEDATAKAGAVDAKIGPLPSGKTIIKDGMINTDLLVADTVIAKQVVTSGTNNITLNQNEDNQLKFRHTNDQVGIQMGIINGELKLVFYNENGDKVWEAGKDGIIYVDNVPESWVTVSLKKLGDYPYPLSPANLTSLRNNINATSSVPVQGQQPAVGGGVNHFKYLAGNNVQTTANKQYEGLHTTQVRALNNWATGWFIQGGIGAFTKQGSTNLWTALVEHYYFDAGTSKYERRLVNIPDCTPGVAT